MALVRLNICMVILPIYVCIYLCINVCCVCVYIHIVKRQIHVRRDLRKKKVF